MEVFDLGDEAGRRPERVLNVEVVVRLVVGPGNLHCVVIPFLRKEGKSISPNLRFNV